MAQNMRTRNPSTSEIATWGTDRYVRIREFCTCPNCRTVWSHKESGNRASDEKEAAEKYSGPTKCGECGFVTEAIPKPSIWQEVRSEYRRTVDREPKREEEEEW